MAYLKRAKKNADLRMAIAGILLVVFGYFTPNIYWTIGVGVLLFAVPFLPRKQNPY